MSIIPFDSQRLTVINMGTDQSDCEDVCIEIGRSGVISCCFGRQTAKLSTDTKLQARYSGNYSVLIDEYVDVYLGDQVILEELCGDVRENKGVYKVIEKNCFYHCGSFDDLQLVVSKNV